MSQTPTPPSGDTDRAHISRLASGPTTTTTATGLAQPWASSVSALGGSVARWLGGSVARWVRIASALTVTAKTS
jgi:hypothetical protein